MLTMQYMNSMDGNFVEKGIISAIKTNTYISYSVLMIWMEEHWLLLNGYSSDQADQDLFEKWHNY